MTPHDVTIVGAGIAGLAAAVALAKQGWTVRVLERAEAISEVGAGLQISPNGFAVLAALELDEAVRAAGLETEAVVLRDLTGKRVARLDLTTGRYARPFLTVHRARLIDILAAAADSAGVAVELRRSVADGEAFEGPVIAADGVRSVLRARVGPAPDTAFTGQVAWRALIPGEGAVEAEVIMGPGCHVVSYPLAGGLRNIVAVEEAAAWTRADWHQPGDPDTLRNRFGALGGPVPSWLAAVERAHVWGLFRHPVAERWHGRGIALIGDAAHPTLPFLAQGANLALEDAWMLSRALQSGWSATALERFQAARRARVVRAIEAANANARNYHLNSPVVRFAAHSGLRALDRVAPSLLLRRFDWLYGYDPRSADI
ncbi:MAG: FAD-dependent oxidoreductase [Pseudomonadota bacterium]